MAENRQDQPQSEDVVGPPEAAPSQGRRWGWRTLLGLVAIAALAAGVYSSWLFRTLPEADEDRTAPRSEEPVPATTKAPAPLADLLPAPDAPPPPTAEALIEEVTRVVGHLLETFPNNADSLEMKARLENWLGHSEEAVKTWEQCLRLDPNYAYACVGMASAAAKKGEHKKAAELARNALRSDPGNFQARAVLAEALIQLGRPDEAVSVLEAFVKADPRSQGHFLLGQAFFQLEEYEKARENYEAAVRRYPDYVQAYYGLSRTCGRLGEHDKAKQAMDKFRELGAPQRAAERVRGVAVSDLEVMYASAAILYTDVGRVYGIRGKPREAERLWRRAAALDSANVQCRQALAWLCRGEGRTRETIDWLEKLAGIEPQNPSYWLEIGRLREELFELKAAEEAFRKACDVAPEQAAGYAALADLLLRTERDLLQAMRLARTAVQYAPTAPNYALLAAACRRNGDHAGALAASEKAAKLAPENTVYRKMYETIKTEK